MKVLYTGSFNPFHKGHEYVFKKARDYFGDDTYVGIGCNPQKHRNLEEAQKNQDFLKWTIHPFTKKVVTYPALTADFCKENGFNLIVRGIRPGKSLEYEEDLMYWNMKLGGIDTIFIPTPPEINQISSSVIRELDAFRSPIGEELINKDVYLRWKNKTTPKGVIAFGKSCIGKSHYLTNSNLICSKYINCDIEVWNCLDLSEKFIKGLKNSFIKAFALTGKYHFNGVEQEQDRYCYNDCVKYLAKHCDWNALFELDSNIDAPVIGSYWNYIPIEFISRFKLVKFINSEENRQKFAKKKGFSKDKLKTLDKFYQDPPYWDFEIDLSKEN